jgi:hypothetical protein
MLYHVTLKFPLAKNEESTHQSLEEAHAAIRKRFPKAIYTDLHNIHPLDFPPDAKLTLIWRNAKKRTGRYGTGADSSSAIGWIFRDDITESEKMEMWGRFAKEDQERRMREQRARDLKGTWRGR